jgi:hypothetical protein
MICEGGGGGVFPQRDDRFVQVKAILHLFSVCAPGRLGWLEWPGGLGGLDEASIMEGRESL